MTCWTDFPLCSSYRNVSLSNQNSWNVAQNSGLCDTHWKNNNILNIWIWVFKKIIKLKKVYNQRWELHKIKWNATKQNKELAIWTFCHVSKPIQSKLKDRFQISSGQCLFFTSFSFSFYPVFSTDQISYLTWKNNVWVADLTKYMAIRSIL